MIRSLAQIFLILFLTVSAGAGISVGNHIFRTEQKFDFRLGFPLSWQWTQQPPAEPNESDRWYLSNESLVHDAAHVSSATFSFLDNFPADEESDLLRVITQLHPGRTWTKINNEDFTVGWVSDQEILAPGRTRELQYYFSSHRKVVRVTVIRDSVANGSVDLTNILATIRRPSGKPHLKSVSSQSTGAVKVGDHFCFDIVVDLLRNDFDRESLKTFDLKDLPTYWSFKTVSWDANASTFHVCTDVTRRFGADGLRIVNLGLSSSGDQKLNCTDKTASPEPTLVCDDESRSEIAYKIPKVENHAPIKSPPVILSLEPGRTRNALHVRVQSGAPLAIGEVTIAKFTDTSWESQILYPDELRASDFEIKYDPVRLPAGFTSVLGFSFTDNLGNMSVLQASPGDATYSLVSEKGEKTPTNFKVLQLWGDKK